MRTKTILLTAAVCAAGVASSVAQVYSVNIVGYVNVPFTTAFKMVANPLDAPTNSLANTIKTPPPQSNFYEWNGAGFNIYVYAPASPAGGWTLNLSTPADAPFAPGGGGLFKANAPFTNTFVGEVRQGNLTNAYPVGYSIRSSQVPLAANANVLGLTAAFSPPPAQNVLKGNNLDPFGYITYTRGLPATFPPDGWSPSTPSLEIGEAVFINATVGGNWTQSFTP